MNQLKLAVSGAQILFVAFGAMVLVPLLTGLNPALALLGAGLGTLLFQITTKRKVPIFLGSSFAFIAPIIYSVGEWGLPSTMFGLFAAGFMYFVFAALIRWRGLAAVHKLLPVAVAPAIEHIGGIMAIGNVTGKDYTKDPGLDKTLTGDGLGVCVAGLIGGPPVTTYGEVTGAVMITKNSNPVIMTWAAVFAVCMAFFGKFNAFLASIPMPVMGGIMLLLFGTIASLGVKTLIDAKVDLMLPKNLVIVSSVLTTGIGGMTLKLGSFSFAGVGLCAVLAIMLNSLLPDPKES
ncbi:TPA: hypothetical protein WI710_000251 [Neisseria meningitidis]